MQENGVKYISVPEEGTTDILKNSTEKAVFKTAFSVLVILYNSLLYNIIL